MEPDKKTTPIDVVVLMMLERLSPETVSKFVVWLSWEDKHNKEDPTNYDWWSPLIEHLFEKREGYPGGIYIHPEIVESVLRVSHMVIEKGIDSNKPHGARNEHDACEEGEHVQK